MVRKGLFNGRLKVLLLLAALLTFVVTAPASALDPSTGSSDAELAKAVAFRAKVGFVDDPAVVKGTLSNPSYSATEWGVPLNPDELSELSRRVHVRGKIAAAFAVADDLPGSAGEWIDQHDQGLPVFMSTAKPAAVLAAIEALVPDEIAYRVEQVELSTADLTDIQQRIIKDLSTLRAEGVNVQTVGLDPSVNGVVVGVEGLAPDTAKLLQVRYGSHVIAHDQAPLAGGDACVDRTDCLPLKGGIKIYRSGYENSQYCTLGMIVRKPTTTILYALTAGHCIELQGGLGIRWKHKTTTWGTTRAETWAVGANADGGLMEIDTENYPSPMNLFYASSNTDIRDFTGSVTSSNQHVGDFVCRSGLISGYNCGNITGLNVTKDVDGKQIDLQTVVDFDACKGDSGGPYYFQHNVWGIHSDSIDGCNPASGSAWFSPIDRVITELTNAGWPILMCLTPTC